MLEKNGYEDDETKNQFVPRRQGRNKILESSLKDYLKIDSLVIDSLLTEKKAIANVRDVINQIRLRLKCKDKEILDLLNPIISSVIKPISPSKFSSIKKVYLYSDVIERALCTILLKIWIDEREKCKTEEQVMNLDIEFAFSLHEQMGYAYKFIYKLTDDPKKETEAENVGFSLSLMVIRQFKEDLGLRFPVPFDFDD